MSVVATAAVGHACDPDLAQAIGDLVDDTRSGLEPVAPISIDLCVSSL